MVFVNVLICSLFLQHIGLVRVIRFNVIRMEFVPHIVHVLLDFC